MEPERLACDACGGLALAATVRANQGSCMACARASADRALSGLHDELSNALGNLHLSNPLALPRNKNTSYREAVLTLSLGVAQALEELGLAKAGLLERHHANPERFYVADDDLTEEGRAFARSAFQKWLAKAGRWKPESRTLEKFRQSLAKELKAFRAG